MKIKKGPTQNLNWRLNCNLFYKKGIVATQCGLLKECINLLLWSVSIRFDTGVVAINDAQQFPKVSLKSLIKILDLAPTLWPNGRAQHNPSLAGFAEPKTSGPWSRGQTLCKQRISHFLFNDLVEHISRSSAIGILYLAVAMHSTNADPLIN